MRTESVHLKAGRIALALIAALLAGMAATYVAMGAQAEVTASMTPRRADTADATDFPCTTSDVFVDIPGMSVTFTVPGSASDEALVFHQGQYTTSSAAASAIIQLVVDGVAVGAAIIVRQGNLGVTTGGFNWITGPLLGTHTAKVQWRSFPVGENICVEDRSLIVLHR